MNGQIGLIDILKAMLSSALAWEDEHGMPDECPQDTNPDILTSISAPIHWMQDGGSPLTLLQGGYEDEPTDSGR